MKLLRLIIIFLFLLFFPVILCSQDEGTVKIDSLRKLKSDKLEPSGLFFSAGLGIDIPFLNFSDNSSTSLCLGARVEYSSLKIYPFVIGLSYQYQGNEGSDDFKTINLLNGLKTTIHSVGLGFDINLNKYLKSSFTIPFLTLEVKYLMAQREINPETALQDFLRKESLIGFSGGLGFTLYVFDIYGTYTHAKNYSSFAVRTRFRIPIIKF
ncbi:MAG: hypothetical protein JW917_00075 [Ignavibacteria bacterium]|nr:hypothetical protein [Ignavibacteria bacterium]